MKFAAISDIHGNRSALEAVLKDIAYNGIDTIVNLGDHFSGPLDAKGTAKILLQHDMICIRGNHDRWLVEQLPSEMGPSDFAAALQLDDNHRQWLAELQPTATVLDDVFLCHGTPKSDLTYWMESVKTDGTVCMSDQHTILQYAQGLVSRVILCGHTHIPRIVRLTQGRLLVNPGSVGCPGYEDNQPACHVMQSGTPDAMYAVLEKHNGQWSASLKAVPYSSVEMVELATTAGRMDWAGALATGWVQGSVMCR